MSAEAPHRVGMIVPSSNVTMETEIPELLHRRDGNGRPFTFHSSRAVLHEVDAASLREMVTQADRCARELADARVDVVAYACLIAIVVQGPGAHEAAEARISATLADANCDAPVTSSAGALVRTLGHLRAKKVAIVAPYVRPLTGLVCDYLAHYGIDVVDAISLEVVDNVEVGNLDVTRLCEHVDALDLSTADAVVLSACVQMPSLAVLPTVEARLGLPVLSAATATAAEVLSLVGEDPYVPRAGAALAPFTQSQAQISGG